MLINHHHHSYMTICQKYISSLYELPASLLTEVRAHPQNGCDIIHHLN